jgi:hypothetical protein
LRHALSLLTFLACFFLFDCALFTKHHILEIKPGFTRQQLAFIYDATDAWNVYANRPIEVVTEEGETVQHVSLVDDLRASDGHPVDGFFYLGSVYIRSGLDDGRFRYVIRHEFGHLLGLGHHGGHGVMVSPGDNNPTITEEDLIECRNVGACDD